MGVVSHSSNQSPSQSKTLKASTLRDAAPNRARRENEREDPSRPQKDAIDEKKIDKPLTRVT